MSAFSWAADGTVRRGLQLKELKSRQARPIGQSTLATFPTQTWVFFSREALARGTNTFPSLLSLAFGNSGRCSDNKDSGLSVHWLRPLLRHHHHHRRLLRSSQRNRQRSQHGECSTVNSNSKLAGQHKLAGNFCNHSAVHSFLLINSVFLTSEVRYSSLEFHF